MSFLGVFLAPAQARAHLSGRRTRLCILVREIKSPAEVKGEINEEEACKCFCNGGMCCGKNLDGAAETGRPSSQVILAGYLSRWTLHDGVKGPAWATKGFQFNTHERSKGHSGSEASHRLEKNRQVPDTAPGSCQGFFLMQTVRLRGVVRQTRFCSRRASTPGS